MSAFKVGQRVRVVVGEWHPDAPLCVGKEATVTALDSPGHFLNGSLFVGTWIAVDGIPEIFCAPDGWIQPLTDPGFPAFLESLERLSREPQIASIPGTLHDYPVEAK